MPVSPGASPPSRARSTTAAQDLLAGLQALGFRARLVSASRLAAAQERIADLHRQGQFDPGFYQERLAGFVFRPLDALPEARSILIAAVPQQQFRLLFRWNGQEFPVSVPPTYLHSRATDRMVLDAVAGLLAPHGFRAEPASLPLKTLVVQSGLGEYGRNNISYVPGLGSFHRPVAVYTDLPSDDAPWRDAVMMDTCKRCNACRLACPTGAIGRDRFLLHAERCLTFLNEKPGDVRSPSWVPPSWNECLVGCMLCQRACPRNRALVDQVQAGPEFSREETALLLRGTASGSIPAGTLAKLEACDLVEYLDIIPRNLGVILGRGVAKRKEARWS